MLAWILLSFVMLVFGGKWFYQTYHIPKNMAVVLSALVLVGANFVQGRPLIAYPTMIQPWLFLFLGWYAVCAVVAVRPVIAFRHLSVLISSLIIAASLDLNPVGIGIFVGSACLCGIYALGQKYFNWDFIGGGTYKGYPVGTVGNTLYLGIFMFCAFWLALWSATTVNPVWSIAAGFILAVLLISKARTALLALGVSLFVYGFTVSMALGGLFLLLAVFGTMAVQGPHVLGDTTTLNERKNFWLSGLYILIPFRLLFGCGADCFKVLVPESNRELNIAFKGKFLSEANYKTPWAMRVHSDYLQTALDAGLPGLFLFFVLIVMSFLTNLGSPILFGCFVGLLVAGLFFHNLYTQPVGTLFWFFLFAGVVDGGISYIEASVSHALTFAGFFTVALTLLGRELVSDLGQAAFFRNRGTRPPNLAVKADPDSSMARAFMGQYWFKNGKPWGMLQHAMVAVGNPDGTQRYHEAWNNLGLVLLVGGAVGLAEKCFTRALSYFPQYDHAAYHLDQIKTIKENNQKR